MTRRATPKQSESGQRVGEVVRQHCHGCEKDLKRDGCFNHA